jgi:hypothetical protein
MKYPGAPSVLVLPHEEFPLQRTQQPNPGHAHHGKGRAFGCRCWRWSYRSSLVELKVVGTLQKNLNAPDFRVLPSIMIIAESVDTQLMQTMTRFIEKPNRMAVA